MFLTFHIGSIYTKSVFHSVIPLHVGSNGWGAVVNTKTGNDEIVVKTFYDTLSFFGKAQESDRPNLCRKWCTMYGEGCDVDNKCCMQLL